MSYFAMPYRVLFHDTMAYGSHHFMTNFKFQCVIREHLLFDNSLDVTTSEGKREFDKVILLTREGYCRNMAPVRVGEKVAILLSCEEPTLSTVRLCFRVVRYDGVPITCGFQTVVCVSSETGAVVSAPPFVLQYGMHMVERLESPSFAERVLAGRTKEVFDNAVLALAVSVANSKASMSYPRFVSAEYPVVVPASSAAVTENFPKGIVFMFPGQGSYAHYALRDLYQADPESALFLQKADKITEHFLGKSILNLVTAKNTEQHDSILERSPDLSQVGIYLGSVIVARYLIKRGLKPDCVVGHSAGELAALAISGVYSDEVGVEIMCNRILALQSMNSAPAGMLAVFCNENHTRSVISEIGEASLQIAVVNHDEQSVVSGTSVDLQRLETRLKSLGIQSMRLNSRYPFHSALLKPAVAHFASFLEKVNFTPPEIHAYSPIERGFYTAQSNMTHLLASHLVRPFTFPDALLKLSDLGGRIFIECGGGDVLCKLLRRVITNKNDLQVHNPLVSGRNTVEGLKSLIATYIEDAASPQPQESKGVSNSAVPKTHRENSETALVEGMPIAIVSMGCVLPGAESPQEFWRNILEGRSGISDAAELRPDLAGDFLSQGEVVPDKTYTLLGGFVRTFNPDSKVLPYNDKEFSNLSSAQRFLAVAINQCLTGFAGGFSEPHRIHIYLGSTGDGVIEYDEALLLAGLHHEVDRISVARDRLDLFHQLLDKAIERSKEDLHNFAPHTSYSAVAERFIGEGAKVICVDAACASSLYAIDIGIGALLKGECDIAFCGGVFAPGPGNLVLFSQFRGLSATGSRPLDASADGVVFGEGAALLILKRLPDAIAAGDRIHAVIRGCGLSNDGKSPSVAVPRRHGQVIALQRAYRSTSIPPESIQYIEAHATATPVGDTEEFKALREVFINTGDRRAHIELGSVKALIGHTGWLAGAVSVIKMAEAMNAKLIPPQNNFISPNPNFDITRSSFKVSTESKPWPDNNGSEPRRAGVNGFGFGGSNAHVIMEEYVPDYHLIRWEKASVPAKQSDRVLSVVGVGALFPFSFVGQKDWNHVLQFEQVALKLPKGFMILPDVADNMDKGQLLAFLTAFEALKGLGDVWKSWKSSIGVVIGVEGKTGLGISVNKRIYIDFLEHRLNELSSLSALSQSEFLRIKEQLFTSLRSIQPSGPYTLPGLMPNVIAGRVGNLLDLNGPNFVLDAGELSLFEALSMAETMLSSKKAQMVLAGGINGYAGPEFQHYRTFCKGSGKDRPVSEGAMVIALVEPDFARSNKLPVLAELNIFSERDGSKSCDDIVVGEKAPCHLNGAEGALDITQAIKQVSSGEKPIDLLWPPSHDKRNRIIRISAPGTKISEEKDKASAQRLNASEKIAPANPIYFCTPRLTAVDLKLAPKPFQIQRGRMLVLADQPSWQEKPETKALLNEMDATILCPAANNITNAIPVDLSSEESIAKSLQTVDFGRYDGIIAIKDLSKTHPLDEVVADGGAGGGLLDLMFVVVQKVYERMKGGNIAFGSICLNSIVGEHIHPYSGFFSGFIKAIAREFPQSLCKVLVTDTPSLRLALNQLEIEWGIGPLPAPAEIIYKNSMRYEYTLQRLNALSSGDEHLLNSDSVVIATGGGRGVTAVLVEDLLRTFGCTVILLGRTTLSDTPHHILSMSRNEFDAYETSFYREEMKRSLGVSMSDLKKRYEHFRNAREIQQTLSTLNGMPGNVEYISVDITDGTAVDAIMQTVAERLGRVDLFVHGAGIQVSKNTARKRLEEFRRIVATKIGGLGNLHRSFRKHFPGAKTHFHLITSVFSYFGNDGQPDYGAANEAMNHIVNWMGASGTDGEWTSLAWLGWAGIGMTRGSEYEALARLRGLRPVTKEEGQAIFLNLLHGRPLARANLLISDGEIAFYKVNISDSSLSPPSMIDTSSDSLGVSREVCEVSWNLSLNNQPYILDHVVGGRPTYPGSFEVELAIQAASSLRPNLHIVLLEDTNLMKFIKFPSHSDSVMLRGRVQAVSESSGNTLVRVQLLSDFVHSSGKILQKDVVHFETTLHMSSRTKPIEVPYQSFDVVNGISVSDPYLSSDAFVRLQGFFDCIGGIEIGLHGRKGKYRIKEANMLSMISHFHTPSIMVDAALRFSSISVNSEGLIPLYVPIKCREIYIASDINDAVLAARGVEIELLGSNPRIEGQTICNDWVQASDREGRVLLLAKDMMAMKVGEVPARMIEVVGAKVAIGDTGF